GKSNALKGVLILIGFICVFFITHNVALATTSIFVATMICLLAIDMKFAKRFMNVKEKADKNKVKELLIECLPLGAFGFISSSILNYPAIILEKKFVSINENMMGAYNCISQPILIIQMLATYIYAPFIVMFAEYNNNKDKKKFMGLLHKILLVFAGIAIVGLIGSKLILGKILILMYRKKVEEYLFLMLPLVGCAIATGVLWFFNMILTVIRKTKLLIVINIVAWVFIRILTPVLIDKCGANGASFGLIITLVLQSIVMYVVVLRHVRYKE
ncbi:MAG: hypothetical protein K6G26_08355, partial [Lachnospiraceae bacterium]|nr:hypothetical protein [Lachnospiraceae bacterium]